METIADKQISDLVEATSIQAGDLYVLEQGGVAKKLLGQTLINWLTSYADGHGGIQSISIVDSGTPRDGAMHTATIHYADTTTSTFTYYDGLKGDTGDASYVHIKYARSMPTQDADMGNTPDNWIGVYSGTSATPPTHWGQYTWFQWKGDPGPTGYPATIVMQSVTYGVSTSGTVAPDTWLDSIPTVPSGSYLWCKTTIQWNSGQTVTSYSVSRNGVDGQGAVSSVNGVSPDQNGNIPLSASDIACSDNASIQSHIDALEAASSDVPPIYHFSGSISASSRSFSNAVITANSRVINCVFGTPSAITSAVTWVTTAGDITFNCQFATNAQTTIEFDIVETETP